MSARDRDKPADRDDSSARENGSGGSGSSDDAEERARRLEEIRQTVVEEWRWREAEKDD